MTLKVLETENLVIPPSGITILDFYADWCGPCKMMDPILKEISNEEDVTVIKINTDTLPKLSAEYQISSLPTTFFLKNGSVQAKKTGAISKSEISNTVEGLR